MKRLIQMPPEVAQVFGNAGPKFVDFLADVLSDQKDEVQQMSALSFEKTLTKEIASVRLEISDIRVEIADVRTEMAEMRAETQTSIAELRTETQTSIAELRADMHGQVSGLHEKISDVHKQISGTHERISDIHKQISNQTKWLLAMMLAAATIYPIINQLVQRYL